MYVCTCKTEGHTHTRTHYSGCISVCQLCERGESLCVSLLFGDLIKSSLLWTVLPLFLSASLASFSKGGVPLEPVYSRGEQ